MARITQSHLGNPSGKLGNVVYKRRNKKTFSQMATEVYNETISEKVKKNRNLFREVTLFANFVNRSPTIKHIWKYNKTDKRVASNIKIFSNNYSKIKQYGVSSHCRILPHNLPVIKSGVAMDENKLTISFMINKGLYQEAFKDFKAPFIFTAVIRMEDPVDETAEKKMLQIRLEEKIEEAEFLDEGITYFTFDTEEKSLEMINDYNRIIVFPAIISLNEYKQPHKWIESGGINFKGEDRVYVKKTEPEPVQKPGVFFDIEYRK